VQNGKLYSCVCGVVERVNKLISVRPLRARYMGEVGDVVVGRISDLKVGGKRWKVDIQGRLDATLLLSSVNLPGGVQRRKTYEDQLNMRNLFVEDDAIAVRCFAFALLFVAQRVVFCWHFNISNFFCFILQRKQQKTTKIY